MDRVLSGIVTIEKNPLGDDIEYSIIGEIVESKGSDEKVIINGINS